MRKLSADCVVACACVYIRVRLVVHAAARPVALLPRMTGGNWVPSVGPLSDLLLEIPKELASVITTKYAQLIPYLIVYAAIHVIVEFIVPAWFPAAFDALGRKDASRGKAVKRPVLAGTRWREGVMCSCSCLVALCAPVQPKRGRRSSRAAVRTARDFCAAPTSPPPTPPSACQWRCTSCRFASGRSS